MAFVCSDVFPAIYGHGDYVRVERRMAFVCSDAFGARPPVAVPGIGRATAIGCSRGSLRGQVPHRRKARGMRRDRAGWPLLHQAVHPDPTKSPRHALGSCRHTATAAGRCATADDRDLLRADAPRARRRGRRRGPPRRQGGGKAPLRTSRRGGKKKAKVAAAGTPAGTSRQPVSSSPRRRFSPAHLVAGPGSAPCPRRRAGQCMLPGAQ